MAWTREQILRNLQELDDGIQTQIDEANERQESLRQLQERESQNLTLLSRMGVQIRALREEVVKTLP